MRHLSLNFDVDQYINPFVPRNRTHRLPKAISWFLGHRSSPPAPIGNVLVWFWAFLGALCGILVVEAVFNTSILKSDGAPIVIGSFGASAILEYNTIDSPLAQPRNVLLGQLFSSIIGVSITKLFALSPKFDAIRWIGGALAVGLSSAFMGFTKSIHPPAGATALLAVTSNEITQLGWFLVPLIVLGSVLMLAVACVMNNIQRKFPVYWWTPVDLTPKQANDADGEKGSDDLTEDGINYDAPGSGESPLIIIDSTHISVPEWVNLGSEEINMLQVLRGKLQERLGSISSRGSQKAHVKTLESAPEIKS